MAQTHTRTGKALIGAATVALLGGTVLIATGSASGAGSGSVGSSAVVPCLVPSTTGIVGPGLQVPGDAGGVDPVVTPDGRYLLYRTRSSDVFPVVNDPVQQLPGTDLDLFDNFRDDLVLLDTKSTPGTSDDTIELVALDSNELGGRLDSFWGNLTPSASHVVFASISDDLVAGDTLAGRDVFIRDRGAGTTERISVRSDGSQPEYTATGRNNDSRSPSVSDDGSVVAFESTNRDLAPEVNPVPGDTWQTYDIYVRDRTDSNPTNHSTTRITVGLDEGQGPTKANGSSSGPLVSPDGRYVWFSSSASNLVAGDVNGKADVFVHDRQTQTTSRVTPAGSDGDSFLNHVSPDGRWVLFSSSASNLGPADSNGRYDAYLIDTQTSTIVRASASSGGETTSASFATSVSDDGRYVVFNSAASELVDGDTNTRTDVFVRDILTGRVSRVSFEPDGSQRIGTAFSAVATGDGATIYYPFQPLGQGVNSIWRADLVEGPCPVPCVEADRLGMIGWWRGQDAQTGVVGPTLTGSAGYDTAKAGRGFVFDGSGPLSTDELAAVSTAVTLEAWIRPNDVGRVQTVMSRWDFPSTDDSARSYHLMVTPDGWLLFESDETSARRPAELRASVPGMFDGEFRHVAAVWSQSAITLYVDGSAVATAPSQGGVLNAAPQVEFRLGGKSGIGDPFGFDGVIDEPTVWRRALSADEIAGIYAAGAGGRCASSGAPIQQERLLASDGASSDWFGWSVDVDGSTAVVGARLDDDAGTSSGSAYVYTSVAGVWSQQAKLTPADGASGDNFGFAVAIDGDTAVVSAPDDDDAAVDSGSVYVFTRDGATWTQQAKLVASDAALGDVFGRDVAIDDDTVVVGAPGDDDGGFASGAAYVFTRSGGSWTQQSKLSASDAGAFDGFGSAVGLDAGTVVIGADGDDDGATDGGSAYVFSGGGAGWNQDVELFAFDPEPGDAFGRSVAISGATIVVGAYLDDDRGTDSGSTHVFTRDDGTWTGVPGAWFQSDKLIPADGAAFDYFGWSVGVDGPRLVVGAHRDDDAGTDAGSAYLYTGIGLGWIERARFEAAGPVAEGWFGHAVAVDGAAAIVGAPLDDDPSDRGSAGVFVLPTP